MLTLDFRNYKLSNIASKKDETMFNFNCGSYRGRSPTNRSDALCIVEYLDGIKRIFATVNPKKCYYFRETK